ncbi:MAG: hypothetical protein JSV84_11990 [Gemmatimonadota bacterium]|nr:MAG: hypothetical protein JSV84_11990 [Gemmatimonadota bacterium]
MIVLRSMYHFMRSDFQERVRSFSFLVVVIMTLFMGYFFVPPRDANYQTLTLGNARGVYNSPWVGTMFGAMSATLSPLITFYLINNAVRRDRKTGVGRIIAGTPTSKPVYVLGKWLSNLAVLSLILFILTVTALGMQLFRGEDRHIDLWSLVAPIWLMGLPVLASVAAMGVLFESVPFLSGSFGNVAYFFLYMAMLPLFIAGTTDANGMSQPSCDFYGMSRPIASMQRELLKIDPDYGGSLSIGAEKFTADPIIFRWEGIVWTPRIFVERLMWFGIAMVLALTAVLPFDRFDPARRRDKSGHGVGQRLKVFGLSKRTVELPERRDPALSGKDLIEVPVADLRPLNDRKGYWRFGTVLLAELRLALRGHAWWWYAGVVAFVVGGAATKPEVSLMILFFSWLWPLKVWSMMGARETHHFTYKLIFSASHPLRRQLAATWLVGVFFALLLGTGVALGLVIRGETGQLVAVLLGAVFIPSLALALGTWSNTPRMFEVIYLILWYGTFNLAGGMDFKGLALEDVSWEIPFVCLGLSLLLYVVAVVGRWKELQR